ncbi:MAG: flagellar hook-length control protein FliK [Lautropia sp.]|nr:flagellar hook-length control protein FliK [Lautropia sp.]
MKTSLPFNTGPVRTPEHATPNGPNSRTGAAGKGRGTSGHLDFKLLFADIKPTVFRDMFSGSSTDTASTLARQQEQRRLDRQRQAQHPREQDQIGLHAGDLQRSPAAPVMKRVQESAPAPARTEAVGRTQREARTPTPAQATTPVRSATHRTEASTEDGHQPATRQMAATATSGPAASGQQAATTATVAVAEPHQTAATAGDTRSAAAPLHHAATATTSLGGTANAAAPDTAAVSAEVAELAGTLKDVAQPAPLPVSEAEAARLGREAGLTGPADEAQASSQALRSPAALHTVSQADGAAEAQTDTPVQDGQLASIDEVPARDAARPQPQMQAATSPTPRTAALPLTDAATGAMSGNAAASTSSPAIRPLPTTQTVGTPEQTTQPATSSFARSEGQGFSLGMALPAGGSHSPVRTDGSPLLASRIDSPVNSQEFREQFARQVAGLTVHGQDRAEIRLTPAELGPIRIRLALSADEAMLDISAAHAATRSAIEASMPTLRQMLAEQGLRLADYRMDQGNTPAFLSQNRPSGQEHSSGMQHSASAFGQNAGQGGEGRRDGTGNSHAQGRSTTQERSTAALGPASGSRRNTGATVDGRLDLFA